MIKSTESNDRHKRIVRVAAMLAASLLMLVSTAAAHDGEITGKVRVITIRSDTPNQALRVSLVGQPSLCGTGTSSITNVLLDDPMLPEFLKLLTAAKLSGNDVELRSDLDGSVCRLKDVLLLE